MNAVVCGRIVIDQVTGFRSRATIGGGAPQALFGACAVGRASVSPDTIGLLSWLGAEVLEERSAESEDLMQQLRSTQGCLEGVRSLPPHWVTPRYEICYDSNEVPQFTELAGFDRWAQQLALPFTDNCVPSKYCQARLLHVLAEGGGDHECMRFGAKWRAGRGKLLSIEPIILRGSPDSVYASVLRYLRHDNIDFFSPDVYTLRRLVGHIHLEALDQLGPSQLAGILLRELCPKVADSMQVIAVRDGARGSYVWSRAQANAVFHVPAVHELTIVDTTGAGNAYAAALALALTCTQLRAAHVSDVIDAACLASAAGAAA
eukprot:CAMPEP_0185834616 /NCGR_PEP_ID=MMETSP1353-20130828/5776_1 /TAXON_ID=1077150 /ORGANISM="Erythrolobus australicus, Strain CCMP3124" /LENGTH=317 /DNA_ID=CAMNT_0028533077 /DNA_START=228 /DNA_END=1178 /DNA_ORIENTATION=+